MMKLLVISHNPLCTYNAMGKTLAGLLSAFRKEELCQLYIYPSFPDRDLCSSYYRITDKDVLHGLIHFSEPGGQVEKEIITPDQPPFESERDENFYHNARNKAAARRLARDGIWRLSRWYGKNLCAWLDREAPDRILVAPGPAKFLYDLALRISRDRRIPIAVYLCDENYFTQPAAGPGGRIQQKLLRRKIEELMENTSVLFTISEELREAYCTKFPVKCHVVMTGSSMTAGAVKAPGEPAVHLAYFGNLRSERYRALIQIGETLDSMGRERGCRYYLDVYSFERNPKILEQLCKPDSVVFHGFVRGKEFAEAFYASDLLVHVESFDGEMIDKVRHSVSTKIADCLASGIPLLAYGPAGHASIEHLRRNDCAFVCTDPAALRETMETAMNDSGAREEKAGKAKAVAARYHDSVSNGREIYELISRMNGERP